jgi:hypothetical protein
MAMADRSGRIILGLIAAINVLLAVGLFALRSPQAAASTSIAPALPAQAAALEARIKAGASGEPYDLTFTNDELNQLVAYALAQSPDIPFEQVRVAILADRLLVDGVTKGFAVALPVRAVVTVAAQDGMPIVRVQDISLGDTELPGPVRDRIRDDVNRSLDPSRLTLPISVETVEQEAGMLTLRGHIV